MKSRIILFALVMGSVFAFSSCKKDYTCTCTTTIGGISTTQAHDLTNQRFNDATSACNRFEDDANSGGVGTTNCHL